jgi:S1/P1 Nuclease
VRFQLLQISFSSFPASDNSLFSLKSSIKIQENENMSKKFIKSLILLATVLLFASPSFAWDSVGHKLSAYIAWQQMTPATREKVMKILQSAPEDSQLSAFYPQDARSTAARQQEFFMIAAYWSDIVRDQKFKERNKYHHGNWHYSDTFWKMENGQLKIIENPNEDGGKALEKLFDFEKVLKDKDKSDADKAIAIAWTLHLVGDIHQPLHTSARVTDLDPKGDQGGNLFLLTPKDTPREKQENLHSFWDRIIGTSVARKSDAPDAVYLPEIGAKIMKKYPFAKMQNRLKLGQFEQWQQESFKLATTEVFPSTLIRFQAAPANYKKRAFAIAEEQIALAGYRLAATFNQIFGQ